MIGITYAKRWKIFIEFSYLGDARKLVQEWLGKSGKILQKSGFPEIRIKSGTKSGFSR